MIVIVGAGAEVKKHFVKNGQVYLLLKARVNPKIPATLIATYELHPVLVTLKESVNGKRSRFKARTPGQFDVSYPIRGKTRKARVPW